MPREIVVLICPNAFKESATSVDAASAIASGFEDYNANCSSNPTARFTMDLAPLADGGDGTMDTLIDATGGEIHQCTVIGPLGKSVKAAWGRMGGERSDTAIIEMARASGLSLVPKHQRDPMISTTYGTGELMLEAVKNGCTRLIVGIGGSATTDGGAGMAQALGARLLNSEGTEIPPGGVGLPQLKSIDLVSWKLPANIQVIAACDVTNPLTGENGAARVFAKQKGASATQIDELERGLINYGNVLEVHFQKQLVTQPGSGAAGGLGVALYAFCNALFRQGTDVVFDEIDFEQRANCCDLIVTGEGQLDSQTSHGKVIASVARTAKKANKTCVALCGSIIDGAAREMREEGLTAAFCIADGPISVETSMENVIRLLSQSATNVAALFASGIDL